MNRNAQLKDAEKNSISRASNEYVNSLYDKDSIYDDIDDGDDDDQGEATYDDIEEINEYDHLGGGYVLLLSHQYYCLATFSAITNKCTCIVLNSLMLTTHRCWVSHYGFVKVDWNKRFLRCFGKESRVWNWERKNR